MNANQRFSVQTLLELYVYFADNFDVAAGAWSEFVDQLEMAAMISFIQRWQLGAGPNKETGLESSAQGNDSEVSAQGVDDVGHESQLHEEQEHEVPDHEESEHADWFVFGIALWASGRWPVCMVG